MDKSLPRPSVPPSGTDAQYDLSHYVSFFDPAVRLDNVLKREYLGPERNRSPTNGGIQADERFMRHGAIKCRPGMATQLRFGLDAIGIGKRRPPLSGVTRRQEAGRRWRRQEQHRIPPAQCA